MGQFQRAYGEVRAIRGQRRSTVGDGGRPLKTLSLTQISTVRLSEALAHLLILCHLSLSAPRQPPPPLTAVRPGRRRAMHSQFLSNRTTGDSNLRFRCTCAGAGGAAAVIRSFRVPVGGKRFGQVLVAHAELREFRAEMFVHV